MSRFQRSARTLWSSALVILALVLSAVPPAYAATVGTGQVKGGERHGTLAAADGRHVYDWQADKLIGRFIGRNYQSKILCFTECYAGDKIDDFIGDRNTTILTGGLPGKETIYNGYHRGLAQGLRPGSTTDAAHAAGVAHELPGDSPTANGPNQDIGTGGAGGAIKSCHVLVWAGIPEALDQADINDIRNNFANQPNTTVTVLSGSGAGADGAATFDGLVAALRNIGKMMNPDEQFILFVTDHGNIDSSARDVVTVSGGHTDVILGINPHIHDTMIADLGNDPFLALFTQLGAPPIAPGTLTVSFNGNGPFTVGSYAPPILLDYDGDGTPDQYEYLIPLNESTIVSGDNHVGLYNTGTSDVSLLFVSVDTGAIKRLDSSAASVPQP